jgi:hypothetical protein
MLTRSLALARKLVASRPSQAIAQKRFYALPIQEKDKPPITSTVPKQNPPNDEEYLDRIEEKIAREFDESGIDTNNIDEIRKFIYSAIKREIPNSISLQKEMETRIADRLRESHHIYHL